MSICRKENGNGCFEPFPQPVARRKSFLPYFLYFTKSRRKKSPQGGGEAAERQKDFIGFVRSFCLCALIRGLQNLESPFGKVLILLVRSRHCGELNRGSQNLEKFQKDLILFVRDSCLGADSRFAEPRFSRQGIRLVTFCIVQKVTKKHAGLRPATSIQSSAEEDFSKAFRRHVPNPAFRTRRRRKGFESVRGSGFTA